MGDIRLKGIYTGFSPDLSTGLTFGFKLPTGSYSHNNAYGDVDRDSEIGTGSTDILLGAFHRGNVTKDNRVSWFAQALLDVPTLTQAHYRPGVELDAAAGIYYNQLSLGRVRITPVAQIIASERTSDTGRQRIQSHCFWLPAHHALPRRGVPPSSGEPLCGRGGAGFSRLPRQSVGGIRAFQSDPELSLLGSFLRGRRATWRAARTVEYGF